MEYIDILVNILNTSSRPVSLLIGAVLIHNVVEYMQYMHSRKNSTIYRVMDFVEMVLDNSTDSTIDRCKDIMCEIRGDAGLTQEDRLELAAYTAVTKNSSNDIKQRVRHFLRVNGYYKLYSQSTVSDKAKKSLEYLYEKRSKSLRNLSIRSVMHIFRDDSPLYALTSEWFTIEEADSLWRTIVSRHVSEISSEIEDIKKKGYLCFGPLYKFMQYDHKSDII